MERVLGRDRLARARQHNRFDRQITFAGAAIDIAVTGIEVCLLDGTTDLDAADEHEP
jgi:hypothetical protein